ncbi:MAG: hypothetical protein ABSD76_03870 [Terriglobales bacterium]|jgi:hypothetical protein
MLSAAARSTHESQRKCAPVPEGSQEAAKVSEQGKQETAEGNEEIREGATEGDQEGEQELGPSQEIAFAFVLALRLAVGRFLQKVMQGAQSRSTNTKDKVSYVLVPGDVGQACLVCR